MAKYLVQEHKMHPIRS